MAVTDATISGRAQIGPGLWMVVGTCDPTSTTISVRTGFAKVISAHATYKEDPGDVRPPWYSLGSAATVDEVVFTVTTGMEISFAVIGLQ